MCRHLGPKVVAGGVPHLSCGARQTVLPLDPACFASSAGVRGSRSWPGTRVSQRPAEKQTLCWIFIISLRCGVHVQGAERLGCVSDCLPHLWSENRNRNVSCSGTRQLTSDRSWCPWLQPEAAACFSSLLRQLWRGFGAECLLRK